MNAQNIMNAQNRRGSQGNGLMKGRKAGRCRAGLMDNPTTTEATLGRCDGSGRGRRSNGCGKGQGKQRRCGMNKRVGLGNE